MTRVLVVGLGNMGRSHALAYAAQPGVDMAGLVLRSPRPVPQALARIPVVRSFEDGLAAGPDLVVIATHTDSHADLAVAAMEAGAHVFVEKPLAATAAEAERVVAAARRLGRKLVVGYILRHHPSWIRLIAEARKLGGPWVFRLNLNQRSTGAEWDVHKTILRTTSPLIDCGVHYVDVMCQITDAAPVRVHGIGARLTEEIAADTYNYGQLQVAFADGSVGWYEAGWGPMMSETAYFVKDIVGARGAVSIVETGGASADIEGHTRVGEILVRGPDGDRRIATADEPDHQALCDAEAAFALRATAEDLDLDRHMEDALSSLRVCLAADESIREGRAILL